MLRRLAGWHSIALVILVVFVGVILLWPSEVPPTPARLPEAPVVETRGLPDQYEPRRATFSIGFDGVETDLRLASIFVMPNDTVTLHATGTTGEVSLAAKAGTVQSTGSASWLWTAPAKPGLYDLQFRRRRTRDAITLRAFVKVPFHPDSLAINGYQIGTYHREPYRDNPFYTFPDGFVEVQPHLLEERVTPHFVLGQFVAKQVSDYPKYLLLHERLLLKLELILDLVNQRGIRTPTFHVMSGFRTPHYNRLIGNETSYSVHLYGGAADVFVDTDEDVYMDDVNGDGEADVEDARWMAELVESQLDTPAFEPFVGGLGIYAPAPHRGPFIHVDVRGEPARW